MFVTRADPGRVFRIAARVPEPAEIPTNKDTIGLKMMAKVRLWLNVGKLRPVFWRDEI